MPVTPRADLLGDTDARIVLAVLDGETTISAVARQVGLSKTACYERMLRLRTLGLLTWEEHKQGTVRPLVARVAAPA